MTVIDALNPNQIAQDSALAPVVGSGLLVPLVSGEFTTYANLDLAASAPALQAVADRVEEFLPFYSSVHRGAGYASMVSTGAYEAARRTIGEFVGARTDDVVQIVRNTTDALNLLATAVPGDVVHLDIEHHANLLPWQARGGRVVLAGRTVAATLEALETELARRRAALVAITGASNVTGEVLPLERISSIAHRHGARVVVDGAQLVPHRRFDLAASDIDYVAFSGHKLYAPFGAGVLVGRRDWLDAAPPYLAGGGAVRRATLEGTQWADAPARHEAGTPNVVGAVALAAACEAISALVPGSLERHERRLHRRLLQGLQGIDGVRILTLWPGEVDVVGLVTFSVDGYSAELLAQYLSAEHGIGVRDGRFCAHPLLERLNGGTTAVRASVGVGTSGEDVERLVAAIDQVVRTGPKWSYDGEPLPSPDPRPLPSWAVAPPPATCA